MGWGGCGIFDGFREYSRCNLKSVLFSAVSKTENTHLQLLTVAE